MPMQQTIQATLLFTVQQWKAMLGSPKFYLKLVLEIK
jgi:hypothetical protein